MLDLIQATNEILSTIPDDLRAPFFPALRLIGFVLGINVFEDGTFGN